MNRIEENEKRLDTLNEIVSNLDNYFDLFEEHFEDYCLLNKYYGSNKWFKDRKEFENGKIKNIKAGVLSEDAIWNLDENINELLIRMKNLSNKYNKNKNSH